MNNLHLLSDTMCKGLWGAFHSGESYEAGITALSTEEKHRRWVVCPRTQ